MRRSLKHDLAKMLIHALISSRIDYCNSFMFEAPAHVIRKLQVVLNAAARLITGLGRYDHVTRVMRDELHWLPVKLRITNNVELLVFKCLRGSDLTYLAKHCITLTDVTLQHYTRSVIRGNLAYPRSRTH